MRTLAMKILVSYLFFVFISFEAVYGDDDQDLTEMDLADLLSEKIIPSNVLGTHTHMKGEWMIGYQYMFMDMSQLADGTQKLSAAAVLTDFNVTPTAMQMQSHMAHAMYAPSDDLTFFGMASYHTKSMDHLTWTGVEFTTRSAGFGDIKLGGLYQLYRKNFDAHRIILEGSVSLPTGSIERQDFLANPVAGKRKLPYTMQIGSGTFDVMPGVKYVGTGDNNAWGAELEFIIRLGKNKNGYALGNILQAGVWYRHQVNDWLAPFIQVNFIKVGNIRGEDPDLSPILVPTTDPARYGYRRIDVQTGVNIFLQGALEGNKVAIEVFRPIYQSLNGPQLRTQWHLRGGWQWAF